MLVEAKSALCSPKTARYVYTVWAWLLSLSAVCSLVVVAQTRPLSYFPIFVNWFWLGTGIYIHRYKACKVQSVSDDTTTTLVNSHS